MELFEAIQKRHSYRGPFLPQPVPRPHLQEIIQAGLQAPSGVNAQPVTFVAVDDPELLAVIRPLHATNLAMQQAQAYIACIVDKQPEGVYYGYSFQVEDCAAAIENMLLAITALGYATVWVDGWLRLEGRAARIGELLGVPESKYIRVLLPLGIPAEAWRQKEKKPFAERVWFNRFAYCM